MRLGGFKGSSHTADHSIAFTDIGEGKEMYIPIPTMALANVNFILLLIRQKRTNPPNGTIIAPRVPDMNSPITPIIAIAR